MKKIVEINTLQDFITELTKLETDDYYFRGEPSVNYNSIVASAFRLYSPLFSKEEKITIDYQKMLDEYYTEIAHELLEIERDNFLHYAQHHGLPTPLIDITANPLTALFFACSNNFEENTCRVHMFNRDRFIDLSNFPDKKDITLNNFFFDNEFTYQIIEGISELSDKVKNQLLFDMINNLKSLADKENALTDQKSVGKLPIPTLVKILREHSGKQIKSMDQFCEQFISAFSKYFSIDSKYNCEEEKNRITMSIKGQDPSFVIHFTKWFSEEDKLPIILSFLIEQQAKNLIDNFHTKNITNEEFVSDVDTHGIIFPPIVIQPSVKFERMKSQEGAFLYQVPHFNGTSKKYIGFAKIEADTEFIINNKKDIFVTLNKIGISKKTIFPDHDNIAEYLKMKFLLN